MDYFCYYDSPIGVLKLTANEKSVTGLVPEDCKLSQGCMNEPLAVGLDWLDQYFQNKKPEATALPLEYHGTPFQEIVWELLIGIPYGNSTTYGALARQTAALLGKCSMSAQAVGQAVGANPVGIIIPCHRVLGAGGKITGYAWGLEKKRWLLEHEMVEYTL